MLHRELREKLNELRLVAERCGVIYDERNVYNGYGVTVHLRSVAMPRNPYVTTRTLPNEDVLDNLRRALAHVRRQSTDALSTDSQTGVHRIRLAAVTGQMKPLTSRDVGSLCRHVGLSVVERAGRMWVLCDRAWAHFLPMREPVP